MSCKSCKSCKSIRTCKTARPQDLQDKDLQVTIAAGFHLFPFRTEKLSLPAPMVLRKWESR